MTYKEAVNDQKKLVKMRARRFKNLNRTAVSNAASAKSDVFFPAFINKNISFSNH